VPETLLARKKSRRQIPIPEPESLLVTARQAARLLGVSVRTVHYLCADHTLPSLKLGKVKGHLRVPRVAVLRLVSKAK
jgi:excisionase family DNA binding protein